MFGAGVGKVQDFAFVTLNSAPWRPPSGCRYVNDLDLANQNRLDAFDRKRGRPVAISAAELRRRQTIRRHPPRPVRMATNACR